MVVMTRQAREALGSELHLELGLGFVEDVMDMNSKSD